MLQRAAFLIAFLAGSNVGSIEAQALGVVTSVIAISFGAWYGIWLGLMWYAAVYEEGSVRSMFHWLRTSSAGQGNANAEAWELDELVVLDKKSAGVDVTKLEYFEANTVKFGSNAISSGVSHGIATPKMVKAKAPVRKSRKTATKKSLS